MKSKLISILKIIAIVIVLLIATVGGYLGFLTIKDYRPEKIVELDVENNVEDNVKIGEELTIITNNIGFGGMDKDVHFFMDGGTMSRGISEERVIYNTNKEIEVMKNENPNFMMIQEADIRSTRSYNVDQYDYLKKGFSDFAATYAINYDVPWLALPLAEPHGRVLASQVTLSNKKVISSERIALPIDETWPQRLAGLDRLMLVNRVEVENGKELVVVNVHLSAYDKGGLIRKEQLGFVKEFLNEEYEKGNYVVLGGDFNQAIPGSDAGIFETQEEWPEWLVEMPEDFKPSGYSWSFDGNLPTCRNAGKEYIKGYNFLSIIDGFIVSDNIEVTEVKGIDTEFEYSDHNPVKLKFKLK